MSRRNFTLAAVGLVLAICVALVWFMRDKPEPKDLESVSVRLPIPVVDTAFSPLYLADDLGHFKRERLQVALEPGSPELNPVKMVSAGRDQFAILGGPELLLTARARQQPLVAIALVHKNADFTVVITKKSSGLTKVEDLVGKDVGFYRGHISNDVLHMLFRKANVEVNEVDVGFDYSRFIADQIPAQWAFRTTAGITLPQKGIELNFISPASYGIHTQGHLLVTTEAMIRERPQTVQRFVDATLAGMRASIEDPQGAIDATIRRDSKFSRSVGEKQMEVYRAAILRNEKLGWLSASDFEVTKKQMEDVDLISHDLDVAKAFTNEFVERYHKNNP